MDQFYREQIEELKKQAKVADKIDKQRSDSLEALIKHPGWAVYQELLAARVQLFADTVMNPAGSVDGAVALEWIKGAMSGLLIAQGLPNVIIDAMKPAVPATDEDET